MPASLPRLGQPGRGRDAPQRSSHPFCFDTNGNLLDTLYTTQWMVG